MVYARKLSCGRCARNMGKCLCSTYLVKSSRLKPDVGHAYSAKWLQIFINHLTGVSQHWSKVVFNRFLATGFTGSGKFSGLQIWSNFAENWAHNSTHRKEVKNGIRKPFHQSSSFGFAKYYLLQVSNSNYCWSKQLLSLFFAESYFILNIWMTSKLLT